MSDPDESQASVDPGRGDSGAPVLVCRLGHLVHEPTSGASSRLGECPHCGELTIASCPGCREPILGVPSSPLGVGPEEFASGTAPFTAPRYCHCCGRPFPWTERVVSAVRAAIRQVGALDAHERDQLRRSIDHIIHETPQTRFAVLRINAVLSRIGGESATVLRELIVSIAGDGVKQHLMQP